MNDVAAQTADTVLCPTCYGQGTVASTEPDKFFFITQLREAVGLFAGAMPITPQQAWEEAIERVRQAHSDGDGAVDG